MGWPTDPVTLGAVLLAVVTGLSETLGGQLWSGVVSLIRHPLRRRTGLMVRRRRCRRERPNWRHCSRPPVIGRRRLE
jgi:hypothetical protein